MNKFLLYIPDILLLILLISTLYLLLFFWFWRKRFIDNNKIKLITSISVLLWTGIFCYLFILPPSVTILQDKDGQSKMIDKPLSILFNTPIRHKSLTYRLTHEITGTWNLEKAHPFDIFKRKLVFNPAQSHYPHEGQFFRATYQSLFGISADVFGLPYYTGSNEIPHIYYPDDDTAIVDRQNVNPIKPLILKVANYDPRAFQWEITSEPSVDFEISVEDDMVIAKHSSPFIQERMYSLNIDATPISYSLRDGTIIREGIKTEHDSIKFSTARTPQVKEILPNGEYVLPDEYITINFANRMDRDSVEKGIEIEPEISYTTEWNELSNRLIIKPRSKLQHNTSYTVYISKEIESRNGAKLVQEFTVPTTLRSNTRASVGTKIDNKFPVAIQHTFKTIGDINISRISPTPDSFYNSINANIKIAYKGDIDRAGILSQTNIVPETLGTYQWEENTLVFTPLVPLKHAQVYTINTIAKNTNDAPIELQYTFTTEPKTVLLDAPILQQPSQFTCNITAASIVLQMKGITIDPWDIYDAIPKSIPKDPLGTIWGNPHLGYVGDPAGEPGYGIYWEPIQTYISQHRPAEIKQGWNVNDLLREIDQGNPSIIWWQNGYVNPDKESWQSYDADGTEITIDAIHGMHSEVVVGYVGSPENPKQIILSDPWASRWENDYHYVSIDRFKYLWKSTFNNTAVVVR